MTYPTVPLTEIAEVKLGRQRSPKDHAGDSMRPYVRAANIGWSGFLLDDVKRMNFTDEEMDVYRLQVGDLLLGEASGSAREVGKPAIWEGQIDECAFQNTLIRVRPSGADSRYLLHYFKHLAISGEFAVNSRGAGIYHLGRKALAEWPVPVPPIAEQRRIAAVLDAADALRAKRRHALAKLDTLTQAIFIDMFGDPIVNPRAWPDRGVDGVLKFLTYGHRFYDDSYSELGIPVVRITDLNEAGDLDFASMPRMALTEEERKALRVSSGDLLFARSGATVGKVAIMRDGDPECIAGAYFVWMRFIDEVNPEYARGVLTSDRVRALIAKQSRQAAQQNFSGPAIRRLPMPVPPADLQTKFAAIVGQVQLEKERHQRGRVELGALFASLQKRAFRGEL